MKKLFVAILLLTCFVAAEAQNKYVLINGSYTNNEIRISGAISDKFTNKCKESGISYYNTRSDKNQSLYYLYIELENLGRIINIFAEEGFVVEQMVSHDTYGISILMMQKDTGHLSDNKAHINGDVNGDETVNITDVVDIINIIAGIQ